MLYRELKAYAALDMPIVRLREDLEVMAGRAVAVVVADYAAAFLAGAVRLEAPGGAICARWLEGVSRCRAPCGQSWTPNGLRPRGGEPNCA
ncbi:MAG: hypothetical protein QXP98_03880 [Thermoproteus sp.]